MAYNVSAAFREQCYSGESLYSCRLIIGENTIPISQIASITISSPIIDSNSETFYIGTFISQQLTIEFKNLDGIDTASGTNVELYISQNVGGNDIEVPIGKYVIDESPENYYQSAKIVCLDYAIKFATNLDYSSAFVDNKITIDNLLQWICNHYGVTLGSYPSINGNVEIGTYDSTVSGKRWISYIAEIKGCNAKMDRLGQLTLVPIKSSPAVTINALKSASWELGEKFEISQVTFFDAIRNYTYGNDSENTLFLRQDNPFIIDTNVVQNVYNAVKDLQIWSLKCDNYGDISLDAWDIIQYTLGNETYYTYNNNTITYAMTIMSKVDTKIPTKQQEVTTNIVEGNEKQQIRRLKTEINTLDNEITIAAQQIETIEQDLQNPTSTKENKYFDLEDALDSPLIDFSLYGETQQKTTQGKNIFNYYQYPVTEEKNGVTCTNNGDGTFTLNGTATANNFSFALGLSNDIKQYSQTQSVTHTAYYISGSCEKVSTRNVIRLDYNHSNSFIQLEQLNSTTPIISKTLPSRPSSTGFSWGINIGTGDKFNNLKIKYQVELGTSATDWEEYTGGIPSPNPSYPQPIHNVSGDNTIEICGKNLFDKSKAIDNYRITQAGIPYSDNNYYISPYIKVIPNTQYTKNSPTADGYHRYAFYQETNTSSFISVSSDNTITTPNNCNYIRFCGAKTEKDTAMLEKSSTASEYEAYTGNSQLISLGVENLFDKDTMATRIYGYIKEDLTTWAVATGGYSIRIPCKPNTNYTISANNSSETIFRAGVTDSDNIPVSGTTIQVYSATRYSNTNTPIYVTTGANAKYIVIQVGVDTASSTFDTLQIEKGSKANSYSPYGASYIELNKISTYQDYIYKENDRWYLHKEIGKVVYEGAESESWSTNAPSGQRQFYKSFSYGSRTGLCEYFKYNNTDTTTNEFYFGGNLIVFVKPTVNGTLINTLEDWKTWLGTNKPSFYYPLATPTDTEITDTTLLEQLNNLMTLPLYKNMTHITLTPNDLQPTMKIEYYRDTSINENFVSKEDMTKYYTKVETDSKLQITSGSIMSEVSRVEKKTDDNNVYIGNVETSVTNLQTDTRTLLTFKQNVEENGVSTLKNTLIQADINGLSITKGEDFKNLMTDRNQQISSHGKEIMFMGYDDEQQRNVARIDDIESKRATIGVHRCETTGTGSNKRTAWFYVGGGN